MATVYLDFTNGDDARSYTEAQNPATPWKLPSRANTAAQTGDTVMMAAGTYEPTSGHFALNRPLNYVADGAVIIQPAADETTFGARISSSGLLAGTFFFNGIRFEPRNADRAFTVAASATLDVNVITQDCTIVCVAGNSAGWRSDVTRGSIIHNNITLTGEIETGILFSSNAGSVANENFELVINGITARTTTPNSGTSNVILAPHPTSKAAGVTLSATITNVDIEVTGSGTNATNGILISGYDNTVVSSGSIKLFSQSGSEVYGVRINALVAQPITGPEIDNIDLTFDAPVGHGLQIGTSIVNQGITGGTIKNCTVRGRSNATIGTSTPHNISAGMGTNLVIENCLSIEGYVGVLASITNPGTIIRGNLFVNNKGPFMYAKGTQGGIAIANYCYAADSYVQEDRAILAVESQTPPGTNTTAWEFKSNAVFVSDIANIHALAARNASQVATYTSNGYFLNGVNVDTEQLFGVDSNDENSTLATWQGSYPTERIDQRFSKSEIDATIATNQKTSPILITPYARIKNDIGTTVSRDISTNWVGATSLDVSDTTLPPGISYANGSVTGVPSLTGIFDVLVTACNNARNTQLSCDQSTLTWEIEGQASTVPEGQIIEMIPAGQSARINAPGASQVSVTWLSTAGTAGPNVIQYQWIIADGLVTARRGGQIQTFDPGANSDAGESKTTNSDFNEFVNGSDADVLIVVKPEVTLERGA